MPINKPKDVYICWKSKDLIMRKIIVLSGLLVLTACKKEQAPAEVAAPSYDQLKSAAWMLGSWANNSEQGNFSEYWTMENDSTYQGKSFVVVQNDTVFAERAILSQKGEDVFYSVLILTDSTDTETPFKLTSRSENTLVFENAENPFPKKITYTLVNNDSIFAEISGGGEPQGYPMKRVK